MACYHPLKGFRVGTTDNGKPKYKIVSQKIQWIRFDGSKWLQYDSGDPYGDFISDSVDIPCGQCIGCRLDYSKQWATRCMLEAQYHESSYFLTLTYDDDHLPSNNIVSIETGEILQSPVHTLVPADFTNFVKRLRDRTGQDLRIYGCGEYGTKTFRPHYHIIVFGLKLDDLKIYKRNFNGDILYNSSTIEKCWKYGYSVVAEVNWNTCAYVARYMTKKLKGEGSKYYEEFNLVPPFPRMSRRPGIAAQYYKDHYGDIYRYDKIDLSTLYGGKSVKPPKYFDRLYDVDYPSDMERVKAVRSNVAENIKKNKLERTDMDYMDMLQVQEDNLKRRLGKINERNGMDEK